VEVVVDDAAGECTPGAVVGGAVPSGAVVSGLIPLVVGGAAVVAGTAGVVVEVEGTLVVVVGTLVMVKPPPGLGSTNTPPWPDEEVSVRTASQRAPSPTNNTTSSTVVRRILIRSETGPLSFVATEGSLGISRVSAPSGAPASVSPLA
jgi:hypothetical protein